MKINKILKIAAALLAVVFVILSIFAIKNKKKSVYDDQPEEKNPLEGKKVVFVADKNDPENADGEKGHLEAVGEAEHHQGIYERYIKRAIDIVLSFCGLVVLSPVFAGIALAIKIEDPGPVLFTQKRMGKNKQYFKLHKFRSMKVSTPHDVPTHMLDDPDQYITKVGKFIRAHSLDELPQIWDIFIGNMSVIGPRPGLWNQDVLTAERDKYGANDVKPGLTGLAQINGRDELEIPAKAKLDGEYVKKIGPIMDAKCFLGSFGVFVKDDSVVEGGTGEMKKNGNKSLIGRHYTDNKSDAELIGNIGFGEPVEVDRTAHKKVLITGAGSYVGESFAQYAKENYGENFEIESIDMIDGSWRDKDFSGYDIVYHVAGIAHADVGNVDDETKEKYYAVNTDLAIEVCKKAKAEGVKEFIFMSSMIVYGESAPYGKKKVIDENTVPLPANFYGDSKLQADVAVRDLADDNFKVIVLRPPMIYGKGSKGNYPVLAKLAKKLPIFPDVENERSMLYIENLCEFLCQIMLVRMLESDSVVLMPQNSEWVKTSMMVKNITEISRHKIKITKVLRPAVFVGSKIPGIIGKLVNKAFGNNCYSLNISTYLKLDYQKVSLLKSIIFTEEYDRNLNENRAYRVLVLASVASMIDQFNIPNIKILQKLGYQVDVACNFVDGNTCSNERLLYLKNLLNEMEVNYFQIDFDRNVINLAADWKAFKQVKTLLQRNKYLFIHCHSPIGGVIGRIVCHKFGIKVIYTAHGFHFYHGAPLKNWLLYYPIEKVLSKWTDILITINREDFERAKKYFYAKKTVYVPGVGINIEKFNSGLVDIELKRKELGVRNEEYMFLSVGELSARKNHEIVIKALSKISGVNFKYYIVGKGKLEKKLKKLIKSLGLQDKIYLLGYRNDISELCQAADLFIFPSHQEGLPVALMEAMACKTNVICSRIRGNVDLVMDESCLFNENDIDDVATCLKSIIGNKIRKKYIIDSKDIVESNYAHLKEFDSAIVGDAMQKVYSLEGAVNTNV